MMNIKDNSGFKYIIYFAKWILFASVTGLLGGVIGSLFHICIDHATYLREQNSFLIFFLPLGGVVIAFAYRICKKYGRLDTNRVIDSVTTDEKVPFVLAPLIFFSAAVTHLLGGSAGREGAALQLGGAIGCKVGKIAKLKTYDLHIIVMSGMAAVFSALFGTPLTAAVFAIEVSSVGIMHYGALLPCIIASFGGYWIATLFNITPVRFFMVSMPKITFAFCLKITFLAIMCALIGIAFCKSIHYAEKYFKKHIPNVYIRALSGGALIVILTFLLGTFDYNGAGMDVIKRAFSGSVRYEAFALKLVFTAITIAAGFKGGEIVPCLFVGSTFGAAMSLVLGINVPFGASVGFVALFCSVTNCPLASVMLAMEFFGGSNIAPLAYVCALSYFFSGNCGLYKSQKIVYSKLDESYINLNAS